MVSSPAQLGVLPRTVREYRNAPLPLIRRSDVRSLVLLGGSVRPTPFLASIGRSVLDLPVRPHRSILDIWLGEGERLQGDSASANPEIRILVNRAGAFPRPRIRVEALPLVIQTDPVEFRGTGGLLRDVVGHYGKNDYIVIGNASALLLRPLSPIIRQLRETKGDVALVAHADGSPVDLVMLRCGCLDVIPPIGYCDLKEQGLLLMSRLHTVRVIHRNEPASISARTLRGYIAALRRYYRGVSQASEPGPFQEDWKPVFSVCEDGAEVHPSARLHDAVVLRGGRVEREATVVGSVVCPGGVVPAGCTVVDSIVVAGSHR
jgi:hypothetical protein